MASIVTDPNGRRRISFKFNGARRTLRLGDVSEALAEEHKRYVEHIVACQHAPHLLPQAIIKAIGEMPDEIYDRYASCSLVPPRQQAGKMVLHEMIRDVTAEISHKKPNTRGYYARVFALMQEYLKPQTPLLSIGAQQADAFVAWMRNIKKHGPATVARRIKACRYTFGRAKRWGWIDANPFEGIRAGTPINHKRKQFVPLEDVEKLIEATADREFRCVIALSRIGALRCPSEILAVRWIDVHWDAGELLVHSCKTEGHEGGESRMVPLFPRLKELLWDWYDHAPEGSTYVVESARDGAKNFRTRLGKLIDRVGLKRWPKLFHNLRASRESELLKDYPLATACAWLGHTPEVAAKHYIMDPDKDANFMAAISNPTRIPTRAGRDMAPQEGTPKSVESGNSRDLSDGEGELVGADCARRDSNSGGREAVSDPKPQPDAHSDARGEGKGDFEELAGIWQLLTADQRKTLLAMARGFQVGSGGEG